MTALKCGTIKPGLVMAGLLICLLIGCSDNMPLKIGHTVQDFRLQTLDHGRFYLNQQKGNLVLLVFFSTYCTYCKQELIELKELARKYPPGQFTLAAVCTDPQNMDELRGMRNDLDITCPILLDDKGKLFQQFGFRGLPTTLVIDPQGRAALIRMGYNAHILKQIRDHIDIIFNKGAA